MTWVVRVYSLLTLIIMIIRRWPVLFTDSTVSKVTIAGFKSIPPIHTHPNTSVCEGYCIIPTFWYLLCALPLCLYYCCFYIFSDTTSSNVMVAKFNELLSSMNLLKTNQDAISSKVDGVLKRVSHNEEKGIFET